MTPPWRWKRIGPIETAGGLGLRDEKRFKCSSRCPLRQHYSASAGTGQSSLASLSLSLSPQLSSKWLYLWYTNKKGLLLLARQFVFCARRESAKFSNWHRRRRRQRRRRPTQRWLKWRLLFIILIIIIIINRHQSPCWPIAHLQLPSPFWHFFRKRLLNRSITFISSSSSNDQTQPSATQSKVTTTTIYSSPQRTVITVKSTTSTRTKTTISISTSKEWKAAAAAAVALHRQAAAVLYSIRPPKSRNATSRQPKIIITSSTVRLNRKLRNHRRRRRRITRNRHPKVNPRLGLTKVAITKAMTTTTTAAAKTRAVRVVKAKNRKRWRRMRSLPSVTTPSSWWPSVPARRSDWLSTASTNSSWRTSPTTATTNKAGRIPSDTICRSTNASSKCPDTTTIRAKATTGCSILQATMSSLAVRRANWDDDQQPLLDPDWPLSSAVLVSRHSLDSVDHSPASLDSASFHTVILIRFKIIRRLIIIIITIRTPIILHRRRHHLSGRPVWPRLWLSTTATVLLLPTVTWAIWWPLPLPLIPVAINHLLLLFQDSIHSFSNSRPPPPPPPPPRRHKVTATFLLSVFWVIQNRRHQSSSKDHSSSSIRPTRHSATCWPDTRCCSTRQPLLQPLPLPPPTQRPQQQPLMLIFTTAVQLSCALSIRLWWVWPPPVFPLVQPSLLYTTTITTSISSINSSSSRWVGPIRLLLWPPVHP